MRSLVGIVCAAVHYAVLRPSHSVIRLISRRVSAMINANNWPESSLEQVLPSAVLPHNVP